MCPRTAGSQCIVSSMLTGALRSAVASAARSAARPSPAASLRWSWSRQAVAAVERSGSARCLLSSSSSSSNRGGGARLVVAAAAAKSAIMATPQKRAFKVTPVHRDMRISMSFTVNQRLACCSKADVGAWAHRCLAWPCDRCAARAIVWISFLARPARMHSLGNSARWSVAICPNSSLHSNYSLLVWCTLCAQEHSSQSNFEEAAVTHSDIGGCFENSKLIKTVEFMSNQASPCHAEPGAAAGRMQPVPAMARSRRRRGAVTPHRAVCCPTAELDVDFDTHVLSGHVEVRLPALPCSQALLSKKPCS